MGLKGFIKTVFGSGPNHHGRFRALVIGRAGCGKTSILDRFCGENISDMPGESRGLHKIGKELMSKNNPSFVAHDSRGTEAGSDEEFETVMSFIEERSRMGPLHRIHVIWYCIPIGDRAIQEAEKKFFSGNRFNIPVIAIVTKYDLLIEECQQIIEEDWENDPAFDPSQNDQLEDLSAQARTAARRVFHTHYQDKLMRMPFPPESVVRLANVHINKNSKDLLHDLNLATLRAIKDTDTDVLMVFARAQKIDESLPSFFAL
ncbi:hypothetical protein SISNIDRAFT_127876 [Sistotremastrum niveocremeum HHB9708]|uniref:G domain-containing protein n=1 Tax=Sistotremastrum niveocremeum HHB9708 TaxID=1314777 RepID=A0A164SZ47_9AGAM|nr:hypothetical protein SISNIDRAFT_127876 [Sistotremastrum niveocremeum HHB9708]